MRVCVFQQMLTFRDSRQKQSVSYGLLPDERTARDDHS